MARAPSSLAVRRAVLMGDPTHWGARAGAGDPPRPGLGSVRPAERSAAVRQWRGLHDLLRDLGVVPIVIPPQLGEPGLVYPSNAGFLTDLDAEKPLSEKRFVLANPRPARLGERLHLRQVLAQQGFRLETLDERLAFSGAADFFAAGDDYVFTVGQSVPARLVPALALPPWRRVPGREGDAAVEPALRALVAPRPVLRIELGPAAEGPGDSALCPFGPGRRHLLVHPRALTEPAKALLREVFRERVLELSDEDAALGAANSFALNQGGECFLVLPAGVSPGLRAKVRERGAAPLSADVSAFRASGAVKRLLSDLGPVPPDRFPLRGRPEESPERVPATPPLAAEPAGRG